MDIDPEKRTGLLEQAALAGEEEIGGLTLRPMTAASWSLHQRVKRAAGEEDGNDWSFNLFGFVFCHSQPIAKLRAAYARPDSLIGDIFDFMASRQASDAVIWKEWMERQMEQFAASITQSSAVIGAAGGADPKV
jgi:hypothetical protein